MGNANTTDNNAKQQQQQQQSATTGSTEKEDDASAAVTHHRHDHPHPPQEQQQHQQHQQDAELPAAAAAAPVTPPDPTTRVSQQPPEESSDDPPPPPPPPDNTPTLATTPPPRLTRPRIDKETLAFHAAVAAGDIPWVEAYICRHAEKIRRFGGVFFGEGGQDDDATVSSSLRPLPASGIAAMLMVSGPKSDASGGGGVCPLEVVDLRGRTPLHTACLEGRAGVVRVLLKAGADANAFDDAGFSPLHRCAQSSDLDSASALLDSNGSRGYGDNTDALGQSTISAAAAPTASVNPDVDVLTRKGDYRPIHLACYAGSAEMVSLLARRGADVSAGDKWGSSPLHRACLEGNLGAARAVLDAGAEVDTRDNWKSTPLHRACHSGHAEIVELLLRRGAATSAKDDTMEKPGQSFGSDVSSERRQAVAALLAENEKSRRAPVGGTTGRTTVPVAGGGEKRSPNRYIPPAARAAAAAAAAAEAAAAAAAAGAATPSDLSSSGGLRQGTNEDGLNSGATLAAVGVQPWRRKTSTWCGVSNAGGGGPDLGSAAVHSPAAATAAQNASFRKEGAGNPSGGFAPGNYDNPLEMRVAGGGGNAGFESEEESDDNDNGIDDDYDDDEGVFELEVVGVCGGASGPGGEGGRGGEIRPAAAAAAAATAAAAADACFAGGDDWRFLSLDGAPRPAYP